MLPAVMELRVLSPEDWRTWRSLRQAALAEAPHAFGSRLEDWQGEGDREERWRDRLSTTGARNLVAVIDAAPVGMATGVPAGDGVVDVFSMWVHPAARGRGVADALLRDLEQWARAAGATVLRLTVTDGNTAASALYQRNGFAFTGELGDPMPDGVRHELVMAKPMVDPVVDRATTP